MPAGIPRRARHAALGLEREGRPSLKVEAFVKSYDRYAPEDGEVEIEGSHGRSRRLARWIQTTAGAGGSRIPIFTAGSTSWNGPGSVRSRRDAFADGVATYTIGSWQIGGTARFATGRPYTPVVGSSETEGLLEPVYGDALSRRLPDYVRLDARLTRFQQLGGRMAVFYLEVLNVLDRDNAAAVVYDAEWKNPRTLGRSSPIARWSRAWSSAAMSGVVPASIAFFALGANFSERSISCSFSPGAGPCAGSRCSSSTSWSGSPSRDGRSPSETRAGPWVPPRRSPFTSCRLFVLATLIDLHDMGPRTIFGILLLSAAASPSR